MRTVIAALVVVWTLLTVIAYVFVLPDSRRDEDLLLAYIELGPSHDGPAGNVVASYFTEYEREHGKPHPDHAAVTSMNDEERRALLASFREWYNRTQPVPLSQIPTLVWSTDDNPARRTQCQLFRVWHLRTFGEPVDLITDPSNRDTTKTIVQCIAGAGPDLIESYGPAQLHQFIDAGVAMDITVMAAERGFGTDQVFSAAITSMARDGRQYAFPCNMGYTILLYHRDLFEENGIAPPPLGGWTLAQMLDAAQKLGAAPIEGSRRRVGIMGLGAWGMALADGATFFNADGTASIYNSPQTVAAFQSYLDLMYKHKVMPTPAELSSMASSGGANMNMGAEAASASALFAAKACAMINDGRWSYVTFAQRQLNRTIIPAAQRRIAALTTANDPAALRERDQLRAAIDSLLFDVLVPITDEQYDLLAACLTDQDRRDMLNIGMAHIPTTSGTPWYEAGARVAIVNRASPRAELAVRFIQFLASEEYNNQINFSFDSISGTPHIIKKNGISGPPRALPGLEGFDSPVFVEAMEKFGASKQLSPFIGDARVGQLAGPITEQLTNNIISATEAARLIEDRLNAQITANLVRDTQLREEWERRTGKTFDPTRPLREQVEGKAPAQSHRVIADPDRRAA